MDMLRRMIFIIGFAALAGCSAQKDEQPKIVAEKFLDAISNHRFDEAKKYGTPRMKEMLEVQSSVAKLAPEKKNSKCSILSCTIDGDKAFVIYKSEADRDAEVLHLVRSSDDWLVGQ
jgi:hypothetical protein